MKTKTICTKPKSKHLVIEFTGTDDRDKRKEMVAYFGTHLLGCLPEGCHIQTTQTLEKGDRLSVTLKSYEDSYTIWVTVAKEFTTDEYQSILKTLESHGHEDEAIFMHMVKRGFFECPPVPAMSMHVTHGYVGENYEAEELNKYAQLMGS